MPTNNPNTDWLIEQAKRFESLATSSQTFNNADMIEFFNAELQSVVTPLVQSVNEEFGTMYLEYDTADIHNMASIRIPSQATGARLKNIMTVSSNGIMQSIPRLNPDRLGGIGSGPGFYIRNNDIIFYPRAPSWPQGVLRISYFRRSNTLVSVMETGRVLSVDLLSGSVTLDNAPVGEGWSPGGQCDVIIPSSPFDFRVKELSIVNRTGANVQFAPDSVVTIQVGDIVAVSGFSPVPQFVPLEAMHLIAQLGAARALQSLGDTEGWKIAMTKVQEMRNHLLNLISDRVEGQPKRLSGIGTSARAHTGNYWASR